MDATFRVRIVNVRWKDHYITLIRQMMYGPPAPTWWDDNSFLTRRFLETR